MMLSLFSHAYFGHSTITQDNNITSLDSCDTLPCLLDIFIYTTLLIITEIGLYQMWTEAHK